MVEIEGVKIEKVAVVDDEPNNREGYGLYVHDADMEPSDEAGPFPNLDDCLADLSRRSDAILSDYQLRARNYAVFHGAQLIAGAYRARKPSVLCTKYEYAEIVQIRPFRRWIPSLITPSELNPETLVVAMRRCIQEFQGRFLQARRAHRAMIRIEGVDVGPAGWQVDVCVPTWNTGEIIRLTSADVPDPQIRAAMGFEKRLYAQVNLGAEQQTELYFDEWTVT